jgi:hypothetical protein
MHPVVRESCTPLLSFHVCVVCEGKFYPRTQNRS